MKLNEHSALVGPRVVLVPYRQEHVKTYNEWMQNEQLQQVTASEPLTLEQEYQMCESWSADPDKLTFIILERDLMISKNQPFGDSFRKSHASLPNRMIGDVNLFLSVLSPSLEDDQGDDGSPTEMSSRAELEIMIASKEHRQKGYAKEVLKIFITYSHLIISPSIDLYFVKVGIENKSSLELFKKLGFQEFKTNVYFQQVELRFKFFPDQSIQLSTDPGHHYITSWPSTLTTSEDQNSTLVDFYILHWP